MRLLPGAAFRVSIIATGLCCAGILNLLASGRRSERKLLMAHQPLIPQGAPPSLAPYSPGVKTGNTVYTSGILPLDESGNIVGLGDAAKQTLQVLSVIKSIIEAAGGKMSDIAFNAIFLKDLADYHAMNAVYETFFEAGRYPARYCIRADLVKPDFLVEIASIAHLDS